MLETGFLSVGSGTEAGGGFGVAAGLAADWDWEDPLLSGRLHL